MPSRTNRAAAYILGFVKKNSGLPSILSHSAINLVSALRVQPPTPLHPLSCALHAQSSWSIQGPRKLPPDNK